jgi:hypothetical protein
MAYIVAEVDRFRTEHLLTKVEPDWNTTDKPDKMIALAKASRPELGGVRELAFDDIDAVHEYAKAAAAESAAKTRKKQAAARLLQLADGALQAARGQFEGVPFARGHRHRPNCMQRNI